MKILYVRVQPKQGVARFFRCGMEFTKAWRAVEVDAATAARLEAEQMLEVSEIEPADYEEAAGDSAGTDSAAVIADTSAPAQEEQKQHTPATEKQTHEKLGQAIAGKMAQQQKK